MAIGVGLKRWCTLKMRDQYPRFDGVWETTKWVPGWFEEINALAIFSVLAELRPLRTVEIGSYLGRSTVFCARSNQALGIGGRVTAIDPHTGDRKQREIFGMSKIPTFDMFHSFIVLAGVEQLVDPVIATSNEAAEDWTEPFQFLFVDGWHGYEAVLADGRAWVPMLAEDGVVVFDDALAFEEVRRAIAVLEREGTIHLWGHFYGQAYAGRSSAPPRSVQKLLAVGRIERIARKLDGLIFRNTGKEPE